MNIFKLFLNKLKSLFIKTKIESQPDYHIILHHTRSTDRVFFGPFKNMTEVDDWYKSNPYASQVQNSIEILISPYSNPEHWWYIPLDHPEKLNPSQLALFN